MKYLGIDFGLRKLGLAVSSGELASPLEIIEVKGFKDAVRKISQYVRQKRFEKIVVGMPGGKMGQTISGFVNILKKEGFDVETYDETLSSKRALHEMIKQGLGQKKRRREDAYSAAEILQNFLDSR